MYGGRVLAFDTGCFRVEKLWSRPAVVVCFRWTATQSDNLPSGIRFTSESLIQGIQSKSARVKMDIWVRVKEI